MRGRRVLAPEDHPSAVYHCLSRVVDRRFIFGDLEKEQFRTLLKELAEFCQVRILTFCLMSNHFHLLVEVPRPPDPRPTAEETLEALARLSGAQDVGAARQRLEQFRQAADAQAEAAWLARYHARRWNLSSFMQLLKQRFSAAYNRRQGRKGTLWEERFKSVLVEAQGEALVTMAAYIDLNPVRAGMVGDPKDYRWSGYGEAVAGQAEARAGLGRVVRVRQRGLALEQEEALAEYRKLLYVEGSEQREATDEDGRTRRGALQRDEVLRVLAAGGRMSRREYLGCRVRYFCDGAVLGSREYVEGIVAAWQQSAKAGRRGEAQAMRGWEGAELFTARALRADVFG